MGVSWSCQWLLIKKSKAISSDEGSGSEEAKAITRLKGEEVPLLKVVVIGNR